jgi:hypothetical protein
MGQVLVPAQEDDDSTVILTKRCILAAKTIDPQLGKMENWFLGGSKTKNYPLKKKFANDGYCSHESRMHHQGINDLKHRPRLVASKNLPESVFKSLDGNACKSAEDMNSDRSRFSPMDSSSGRDSISTSARNSNAFDANHDRLYSLGNQDDQARMKFLRRLSCEGELAPKARRPPSHQTFFIFDWDDTLLCTSYLQNFGMCGFKLLPVEIQSRLKAIEDHVMKLLQSAIDCGKTFIITNAKAGWVEASAALWMPSLLDVLRKVEVVSARSCYRKEFPDDVMRWKSEAFLAIKNRFDSEVVTNLVSLGDSEYEMEATKLLGEEFRQAAIKFVKFQQQPSPEDLLQQLALVNRGFKEIVGKGRNLDITFEKK